MPKVIKAGLRPQLDVEAMTVNMQVKEGTKVLAVERFDWADVEEGIQQRLKLAGLSTVLQQRTSDVKADPLGKLAAMQEVFDLWADGEWEKKREGGARTVPPVIEVLAEKKGVSPAMIQKSWSKQTDEFKEAIMKKFATEIEAVIAKRATTEEVDLTDLV